MTLVVCVLGLALLSFVLLSMWAQREREALGLAGGSIVAADDWQCQPCAPIGSA